MINGTTREQLHEALEADDPRAAVREVFRFARDERAKLIAETEVVRASTSRRSMRGSGSRCSTASVGDAPGQAREAMSMRGMHGQTVDWSAKFKSPSATPGRGRAR